jgi:hypothetical protein
VLLLTQACQKRRNLNYSANLVLPPSASLFRCAQPSGPPRMDESKSIEHLENDYWPSTDFPTPLVEKCYRYRKIPVKDLSIEQIRLLLGQKIGVRYLLNKAIKFLQEDILSEGDFFPGDLLMSVLRLDTDDWKDNAELQRELDKLLASNESEILTSDDKKIIKQVEGYKKDRLRTT